MAPLIVRIVEVAGEKAAPPRPMVTPRLAAKAVVTVVAKMPPP